SPESGARVELLFDKIRSYPQSHRPGFRSTRCPHHARDVSTSPRRPATLEFTVFRGSEAVRDGLLTAKMLRGPAWIRVRNDVYADSRLDRDHELACRAASLVLPDSAVISGRSAAYLYGIEHAASFSDPVCITLPPGQPWPRQNLVVHRTALEVADVQALSFCRLTSPLRTAWDLGVWLDPPEAVAIIDGLLREGIVTAADMAKYAEERGRRRGSAKARRAFELADGRAESPPESRMRVRLVLAGLPKPVPQYPILLPSGLTVHPDAAWPEYRVAAEYDGVWHADDRAFHLDRRRLNELLAAGWLVFHATSRRLDRGFSGFVREIRDGLISRGWRP
ncbi:MAG TPA: hypothetical protein VK028_04715, partial [Micromonosporaceae bacterium]|nr:hypothetical protein [Micromonosporaceae bacterium]